MEMQAQLLLASVAEGTCCVFLLFFVLKLYYNYRFCGIERQQARKWLVINIDNINSSTILPTTDARALPIKCVCTEKDRWNEMQDANQENGCRLIAH